MGQAEDDYLAYEASLAQAYASGNPGQIAAAFASATTDIGGDVPVGATGRSGGINPASTGPYDNPVFNYDYQVQVAGRTGQPIPSANDALTIDHAIASGTYASPVINLITPDTPVLGAFPGVIPGMSSDDRLAIAEAATNDALQSGNIAAYHAAIDAENQQRLAAGVPNRQDIQPDIVVLSHARSVAGATSGGSSAIGQLAINAIQAGFGLTDYTPPITTNTHPTQTVPTPGLDGTQSSIPATTAPPLSLPPDKKDSYGTQPAGSTNTVAGTAAQGPSPSGALAAQIQSLGGGPNALLTADQWGFYFQQISGVPAPAPEDMGFTDATRFSPIKFSDWWGAAMQWTASTSSSPTTVAITATTGGGAGAAASPQGSTGAQSGAPTSVAAKVQAAGGGATALLTADGWGFFFAQVTGQAAPAPEDLGIAGSVRQSPMTFASWWAAFSNWAAGNTTNPAALAGGTVTQTGSGGTATPPAASSMLWLLVVAGGAYLIWKRG